MNSSALLISAKIANVLYPVLFSVCTVLAVLVFVWLMIRFMGKAKVADGASVSENTKALNVKGLISVVLAIGLILRLIFVFAVKGYRPEYNRYIDLFDNLKSSGFGADYYTSYGINVLPVNYYIYAIFGSLYNLFGLSADSVAASLMIKLPLIIADLVTAYLLYRLANKYLNSYAAIVTAGMVCVFPVSIFASSVWASQYSLLVTFVVLSLYFLVEKNFIALIGCYSAALLSHKDAIYLFPLVAVFVIYGFVKAILTVKKNKPASFSEVLRSPQMRAVFTVPVSIIGFGAVSYLLTLPLMINSYGAGYFTFLYRIYFAPLASYDLFGRNSLGIFNIFMRNGKSLNSRFPSIVFTVLFAVIITGIVLLTYLSKKNRANLVFLSAYIIMTLATYFVGFTELSLCVVLVVLLASFLLVRDKRILYIFGVLSVAVIVNATTVMASAGYYNNLADYYVGLGSVVNPDYVGSLVLGGGMSAVNIVCSVIAVLAHLYATVVLLDISMSDKRKVLPYCENVGFGKAMALFFKSKNK